MLEFIDTAYAAERYGTTQNPHVGSEKLIRQSMIKATPVEVPVSPLAAADFTIADTYNGLVKAKAILQPQILSRDANESSFENPMRNSVIDMHANMPKGPV